MCPKFTVTTLLQDIRPAKCIPYGESVGHEYSQYTNGWENWITPITTTEKTWLANNRIEFLLLSTLIQDSGGFTWLLLGFCDQPYTLHYTGHCYTNVPSIKYCRQSPLESIYSSLKTLKWISDLIFFKCASISRTCCVSQSVRQWRFQLFRSVS